MSRPNIYDTDFDYDPEDPPGYRAGMIRVGREAGGTDLAVKLFEIPPDESLCPYHYEYEEEWLIVLEGSVDVRVPTGSEHLDRGDVMRFPKGRDGAHKISSPKTGPARILMFSSAREPSVAVYPDSDKLGVWPGDPDDHVMVRRSDGQVPYYDGEA
jgi:uncharacterized cupin superfamily protein